VCVELLLIRIHSTEYLQYGCLIDAGCALTDHGNLRNPGNDLEKSITHIGIRIISMQIKRGVISHKNSSGVKQLGPITKQMVMGHLHLAQMEHNHK